MSGPTWRNSRIKMSRSRSDFGLLSICAAPKSICVAPLWRRFWGTFWSPNCAQVCLLEILDCLLSNPSGISAFGAHFPLQKFIIPGLLPVCQNRGREVIVWVFLTSWGLKTCLNFFSMHHQAWFFMINPKIQAICDLELPILSVAPVARRTGRKTLCCAQKFVMWPKFPQIVWNLGWRFPMKCYARP